MLRMWQEGSPSFLAFINKDPRTLILCSLYFDTLMLCTWYFVHCTLILCTLNFSKNFSLFDWPCFSLFSISFPGGYLCQHVQRNLCVWHLRRIAVSFCCCWKSEMTQVDLLRFSWGIDASIGGTFLIGSSPSTLPCSQRTRLRRSRREETRSAFPFLFIAFFICFIFFFHLLFFFFFLQTFPFCFLL